jgi:hypothetical protein
MRTVWTGFITMVQSVIEPPRRRQAGWTVRFELELAQPKGRDAGRSRVYPPN